MDKSLWVDLDRLRALPPQVGDIADQIQGVVNDLRKTSAEVGACWGDDDPGKEFEKFYLGDALQAMKSIESVAAAIRSIRSGIAEAANSLENQDTIGATRLNRSLDVDGTTSASTAEQSHPIDARIDEIGRAVSVDRGDGLDPAVAFRPESSDIVGWPARTNRPTDYAPSPFVADNDQRQSSSVPQGLGSSRQPATNGSQPAITAAQIGNGSVPTGGPRAPSWPVDRQPPARVAPPGATSPSADALARRSPNSTPWAKPSSDTPWSKKWDAERNQAGTPTRVSAPRRWDKQSANPDSGRPARTAPKSARNAEARPAEVGDAESAAVLIMRGLAAHHSLELAGIEQADLSENAAREIAAAVDHLLAAYPIALQGIEITAPATSTDVASVGRDRVSPPWALWIVLDRMTVAGRGSAEARPVPLVSGGPGGDAAPLRAYIAVVYQFGRLLDRASSWAAQPGAQRALIAEYLRINGTEDTLGRIVRDYRRWCGHYGTSGAAVQRGFDSGIALAQAFTEVELRGERAAVPARVLHRHLVSLARLPAAGQRPPQGGRTTWFAMPPTSR